MELNNTPKVVINVSDNEITEQSRMHWLAYWSYFAPAATNCACAVEGCNSGAAHGVLVKCAQNESNQLYVVPVCKEHGYQYQETLKLADNINPVDANLSL